MQISLIVGATNKRLDKSLSAIFNKISRSKIKAAIDAKKVKVNGKVEKPSFKLDATSLISLELDLDKGIKLKAQNIPLDIIYEDEDIIVVNKPKGMVVHPAPGHEDNTLVNALLYHTDKLSDLAGKYRQGIVHRLDKNTSGILVVAKNNKAHADLKAQFKNREVEKVYEALVKGRIEEDKAKIDTPISRAEYNRQKMAVTASGKRAITYFDVIKRYTNATYIRIKIVTGRTHQIRVHMHYIGHPVLGDKEYGGKTKLTKDTEQLLFAKSIAFRHPRTHERVEFSVAAPEDFKKVLAALEKENR